MKRQQTSIKRQQVSIKSKWVFPLVIAVLLVVVALGYLLLSTGTIQLYHVAILLGMAAVVFLVARSMRDFSVRDIVLTSLMSALVIVATFLKIPMGGAMVHLGSAVLFTLALATGGRRAGLAGGLGSAIFDVIGGFSLYTPWSFAIKFLVGFSIGMIANRGKPSILRNVIAVVTGSLVAAVGYFFAWSMIEGGIGAGFSRLPMTFLTSGIAIAISLPLAPLLKKAMRGSIVPN